MWGSAIPAGKRFQVVDAWSRPLAEGDARAKTIGTRIADITRSNGPGAAILANKDRAVYPVRCGEGGRHAASAPTQQEGG
jgi:hypothetical protein